MERGDDQQHSETDCMTTGPAVASGDPGATVEELKRKLRGQVAQLDDNRILDTADKWMLRLRQIHLADKSDGVDLGVFDGGE